MVIAAKWRIDYVEVHRPLHTGNASPAGDDQAHRTAVRRRNRLAVHLPCQHYFRTASHVEWQAALERGRIAASGEHLERIVLEADAVEQRAQRHPREHGVADGLLIPLIAFARRVEPSAAIARAFEPDLVGSVRQRLQLIQTEGERPLDPAINSYLPRVGFDRRRRIVLRHRRLEDDEPVVVHVDRGERARLILAVGELQFLP